MICIEFLLRICLYIRSGFVYILIAPLGPVYRTMLVEYSFTKKIMSQHYSHEVPINMNTRRCSYVSHVIVHHLLLRSLSTGGKILNFHSWDCRSTVETSLLERIWVPEGKVLRIELADCQWNLRVLNSTLICGEGWQQVIEVHILMMLLYFHWNECCWDLGASA